MTHLKSFANNRHSTNYFLPFLIMGLFLIVLLSGCAATGSGSIKAGHDYIFQESSRFVRLEPIEKNAPLNSHPLQISAEALKKNLSAIQATAGTSFSKVSSLFTEDEMEEIVGPLVEALSRAQPDQDITFQSAGMHGVLGNWGLPEFTSARVFVRDDKLNMIVGIFHDRPIPADDENVTLDSFYRIEIATRMERIESGFELKLDESIGRTIEGRGDWIVFAKQEDGSTVVQPEPETHVAPASPIENRTNEIEAKLQVLDRLKAKGLISEEEYKEQRRAILQGI